VAIKRGDHRIDAKNSTLIMFSVRTT